MSLNKFTLKQYKTIEEVLCVQFDNEITPDEVREDEAVFMDTKGNEIKLSWERQKEGFDTMGYWGLIDDKGVIHFWIKENHKPKFEELLFFFGHEIGHNMKGGVAPQEGYFDNADIRNKEEERADEYGYVAQLAYKFTNQILNKNESK